MKFWRIQWIDDGLDGVQNEWAATEAGRDGIDEDVSIDGYVTTITEYNVEINSTQDLVDFLRTIVIES